MTKARPRFTAPPRGLTEQECAGYLGLGMTEYMRILPRLEEEGFPRRDPVTRRRDFKAIETWWDTRSALSHDADAPLQNRGVIRQRLAAMRAAGNG